MRRRLLERAPFLEWARAELARLPSSKAADEGKATVDRLAEELTAALRRERDRKRSPGPSSIDAQRSSSSSSAARG